MSAIIRVRRIIPPRWRDAARLAGRATVPGTAKTSTPSVNVPPTCATCCNPPFAAVAQSTACPCRPSFKNFEGGRRPLSTQLRPDALESCPPLALPPSDLNIAPFLAITTKAAKSCTYRAVNHTEGTAAGDWRGRFAVLEESSGVSSRVRRRAPSRSRRPSSVPAACTRTTTPRRARRSRPGRRRSSGRTSGRPRLGRVSTGRRSTA